ncbi:MAG: penicillin-binding protein 1A [Alphaproteobacteria bacterium]|nr:penicillin-binding protein 1A [Alphaproteobacteria bacterium]
MFRTLSSLLSTCFLFAVVGILALMAVFLHISRDLPDYRQLEKYEPPITTRLFAGDGQLLMEYATEQRLFVPIEKIPELVKNAFIAAEDKKFYSHSGIDYVGIVRAVLGNLKNLGSGRRPAGASTITQQVAKNFLFSSELSYTRKLKEAIIAHRIEKAFSKDHILELYLNQIYLGNRSYGVAAAALNYFGKPLDKLSIAEIAYLAALPKGPNNYNPKTHYEAALNRRNWVIKRLYKDGYITEEDAAQAQSQPLKTVERSHGYLPNSEYFSEEVRREVQKKFGAADLNEGGLNIRTTLDPRLQNIATKVFREELENYDRRHGYRGALANIDADDKEALKAVKIPKGAGKRWQKAVVTKVSDTRADIMTANGKKGVIPFSLLSWARKNLDNQFVGDAVKKASDVLMKGDVILVEKVDSDARKHQKLPNESYYLRQVPDADGGLIAIDPHTGKVLAIVGGYSFERSQFNRATQARRQTGSAFKPFVYLTALENGYSPTDLILDAPFVLDQGPGLPRWKPENYSKKFYGLMTLRSGIEKSRNLMTVRLAQDVGMDKISAYAAKLNINPRLPKLLSMSLGAGETHLISLTTAYAMIVNGGKKISPYFIEQIQDRYGQTILKHDNRQCDDCNYDKWDNNPIPVLEDNREQLIDSLSAYQMTSILEGVAVRGTGARLRALRRHLGGKTGTTNDNKEGWFIGFSPDLVVGTYVGFDEPRSLGRFETGASVALPIFYRFMEEALKGQADVAFRIPAGIKLVRINYETGLPAQLGDEVVIIEALKPEFNFATAAQRVIGEGGGMTNKSPGSYKVFGEQVEEEDFRLGSQY